MVFKLIWLKSIDVTFNILEQILAGINYFVSDSV